MAVGSTTALSGLCMLVLGRARLGRIVRFVPYPVFGGFLAMKRLAGWADAYSLVLAPHNVCGPVGTMANLHFAVATPNYKVLEHFNDFADSWVHELVDASPRIDPADGCFVAPERPGLGLKLNHDVCAKHPRTGGRIKLFEQGWERRS